MSRNAAGLDEMNDQQVRIDKHVPFPDRGSLRRFPFAEMEIGDSFLADAGERAALYHHMRSHGPKRFITRTVTEEGQAMLRVWRVT